MYKLEVTSNFCYFLNTNYVQYDIFFFEAMLNTACAAKYLFPSCLTKETIVAINVCSASVIIINFS